jgi:hypothetical protein
MEHDSLRREIRTVIGVKILVKLMRRDREILMISGRLYRDIILLPREILCSESVLTVHVSYERVIFRE